MMSRIIVKALPKRNETGLVCRSAASPHYFMTVRGEIAQNAFLVKRISLFARDSREVEKSGRRIRDGDRSIHESCGQEPVEKGACLQSFLPIGLYKSTRRERLNLYRCMLTQDAWPTRVSGDDATATHENTVTARHPTASRLGRCHLVMRPTRCGISTIYWHKRCT